MKLATKLARSIGWQIRPMPAQRVPGAHQIANGLSELVDGRTVWDGAPSFQHRQRQEVLQCQQSTDTAGLRARWSSPTRSSGRDALMRFAEGELGGGRATPGSPSPAFFPSSPATALVSFGAGALDTGGAEGAAPLEPLLGTGASGSTGTGTFVRTWAAMLACAHGRGRGWRPRGRSQGTPAETKPGKTARNRERKREEESPSAPPHERGGTTRFNTPTPTMDDRGSQ